MPGLVAPSRRSCQGPAGWSAGPAPWAGGGSSRRPHAAGPAGMSQRPGGLLRGAGRRQGRVAAQLRPPALPPVAAGASGGRLGTSSPLPSFVLLLKVTYSSKLKEKEKEKEIT